MDAGANRLRIQSGPCVQVKSGQTPVGVNVFRELRGLVQHFNADQGLLVSWGGFNSKVIAEAASSFFTVRLWDSGDLLSMSHRQLEV